MDKIKFVRSILHILLLILTTVFFAFSLLSSVSGQEKLIENLPNTLPWIALYLINIITFRNETLGGVIMIAFAIFLFFFFNILPNNNWIVLFVFILPILLLGVMFLIIGIVYNKYKQSRIQ